MQASEIRKTYLSHEEIYHIINNSGFTSIEPFLEEVLIESRKQEIDAIGLINLQAKIAVKIIYFEKQIKYFRTIADREKRNQEWLSMEIYKAQRKILKQVMDGVAFRFLNFNKPYLRQLIAHNQTGFLTEGFLEEVKKAEYIISKTGLYVILNDLTNFLRYGDLTVISPKGVMIDEVKTTGSSKGNQKKSLDELINNLQKRIFKIGDQTAHYIKIEGKPATFLSQVESIIDKSRSIEGGVYAVKVSPYLWVSSLYSPKVDEYYKATKTLPKLPENPFKFNKMTPPLNSLMFFDEISPNITPYSVFPFSEKTICELMIGKLQIKTMIGEKEMVKSFKGKGWDLVFPSREDIIATYNQDDIDRIKEMIVDPNYFYTLKKGNFEFKLPREVIGGIETEFRSVKSIVDGVEGILNESTDRKTKLVTWGFSEEYKVWK